jgi:hypothetical protein
LFLAFACGALASTIPPPFSLFYHCSPSFYFAITPPSPSFISISLPLLVLPSPY